MCPQILDRCGSWDPEQTNSYVNACSGGQLRWKSTIQSATYFFAAVAIAQKPAHVSEPVDLYPASQVSSPQARLFLLPVLRGVAEAQSSLHHSIYGSKGRRVVPYISDMPL
jgi:hypothetical protein